MNKDIGLFNELIFATKQRYGFHMLTMIISIPAIIYFYFEKSDFYMFVAGLKGAEYTDYAVSTLAVFCFIFAIILKGDNKRLYFQIYIRKYMLSVINMLAEVFVGVLVLTLSMFFIFLFFEYDSDSVWGVTSLILYTFVLLSFTVMFIDWLVYYIEKDYWVIS